MPSSAAFDHVSRELAERTDLASIEARGTLRIALKSAGLEAGTVTPEQMAVVLERIMPGELEKRGISEAQALCERIRGGLTDLEDATIEATPESVFNRLGGAR